MREVKNNTKISWQIDPDFSSSLVYSDNFILFFIEIIIYCKYPNIFLTFPKLGSMLYLSIYISQSKYGACHIISIKYLVVWKGKNRFE